MTDYQAHTKSGDCIFCKIVSGEVKTPGIFWEDGEFIAFLSIDPNTEGFSCVIPKEHHSSDIFKMPEDVLSRFIIAAKTVAKIFEEYFEDVGRVGLLAEGMGIDHAHFKLQPMHGTEHLKTGEWKQILSGKNFWFEKYEGWICSGGGPTADPEHLRQLATEIKKSYTK